MWIILSLNKYTGDIKKVNSSKNVFVFAYKTTDVYQTVLESYKELLTENITKTYKIRNSNKTDDINWELRDITNNLSIWNRVDVIAKRDAFITTIKDHKEKFSSNVNCRLINLSKSELGKVSEVNLDNINNRPGKSVQCSSDPEFAFFKCSSIILVVKLLRKQNNLQILLTGYEEHFAISK